LRVESPLNTYLQLFIGLTKVCEPADIHYRVLMATERGSDCENRQSVDFASGFSELLGNYVGLRDYLKMFYTYVCLSGDPRFIFTCVKQCPVVFNPVWFPPPHQPVYLWSLCACNHILFSWFKPLQQRSPGRWTVQVLTACSANNCSDGFLPWTLSRRGRQPGIKK
jgi:hypothetical protein